ncbi:hypothetical protein NPJ82_09945 [Sphingomonas sp. NY01]|uniref:hypothetical protein n=1 Tax=Sphingomonas sp. NY01 TaxID=2968057 RepID=UPI00315CBC9B
MIYKWNDEWKPRHAIRAGARCIVEAEPPNFAHPRYEQPGIEPADHVALCFVHTGTQIAAVDNASIGMNTAASITFKTDGTAQ